MSHSSTRSTKRRPEGTSEQRKAKRLRLAVGDAGARGDKRGTDIKTDFGAPPPLEQLGTPVSPGHSPVGPDTEAVHVPSSYINGRKVGSLISLHMRDFQVCVDVSYQFGPALNMLIAPNGSGKSTVVTAIFLLFGGDYKRAHRSINEYVRIGQARSEIEATILGKDGEEVSIGMHIEAAPKHEPTFYINGRRATKQERDNLVARYNIQVNNMCQFLQQERVAAFSAETAQQRLRSTQIAIGSPTMLSDQDRLETLGQQLLVAQAGLASADTQLEKLTLQRDEHQAVLASLEAVAGDRRNLETLEDRVVMISYVKTREDVNKVEAELVKVRQGIQAAKKSVEGLHKERDRYLKEIKHLEKEHEHKKRALMAAANGVDVGIQQVNGSRQNLDQAVSTHSSLLRERDDWESELNSASERAKDLRKTLEKCKNTLPSEAESAAITAARDSVRTELMKFTEESDSIDSRLVQLRRVVGQLGLQRERNARELGKIGASSDRLIHAFPRNERRIRNISHAIDVLDRNKDRFENTVYHPPVLSATVNDTREIVTNELSQAVSEDVLLKFTCVSRRDYEIATALFMNQGVNAQLVDLSQVRNQPASDRRPLNKEQLLACGFEGWLIDLFDAPEPVLNMMCILGSLNRIPFTTGTAKGTDELFNRGVSRFVDSNASVSIHRSKYGSRSIFTTSTSVTGKRPSIVAMGAASGSRQREALQKELADLDAKLAEQQNLVRDATQAKSDLEARKRQVEETSAGPIERYKQLKRSFAENQRVEKMYKDARQRLQKLRENNATFDERLDEALKTIETATKTIDASKIPGALERQFGLLQELTLIDLTVTTLRDTARRLDHELRTRVMAEEQLEPPLLAQLEDLRSESSVKKQAIADIKKKLGKQKFDEEMRIAKTADLEQVKDEISALKAHLSLEDSGQNYEETRRLLQHCEEEIYKLGMDKAADQHNCLKLSNEIDRTRVRWETELHELIATVSQKYSELFAQLSYRGAVQLDEEGLKFGEWGLNIMVSFRQGQSLCALSSRRQSGGERAVATAVFLLALQNLAKAPFCVVDEINQGMDHFNESNIHRFIVEAACTEPFSQYFLVTPKLLPDLAYNTHMKVHCVNGGPKVSTLRLDRTKLLARWRALAEE